MPMEKLCQSVITFGSDIENKVSKQMVAIKRILIDNGSSLILLTLGVFENLVL